jgi:phospholipase C
LAAQSAGASTALTLLPPSIQRALAIPAASRTGTIKDVEHVVILMLENRSFDHYFGTMRGVRGFGDPHPIPLESGKPVWFQSDGQTEIPPYHHDTRTTSAIRVPVTPHSFADAQAAWNQGNFGFWPKYKTAYSMGHYTRYDIPFQFALAEAFTICDAYHCSVTTGTDPNRIFFWSGSNFDPKLRAQGINCTDETSEPDNLRCWIEGKLPEPGYIYAGNALTWPTIPEVLQDAGISWRIYQDPNDNWTGAMHGCLAFESFRSAKPGSPIYENGMRHWSLEQLAEHAKAGTLPQVSWVLPPATWSEHPLPSSPLHGAEFTTHVLNAITANPETWSKTVFFITFDENDGRFDHVPPPAVPSFNVDGTLAGKSTVDLKGMYFDDPQAKYRAPGDTISGNPRPWAMGPRVPMYVVSPWSKGGWVNSQVFDHSSVGQFLEKRFGVTIPAISPWHRAVSGDLTSAFDFIRPNDPVMPTLPAMRDTAAIVKAQEARAKPLPPAHPEALFQEPGARPSRPLPYVLEVDCTVHQNVVALRFRNDGKAGTAFHVYDKHNLSRIPRRYTVEAGRSLSDVWVPDNGHYDLWVLGPNGFLREFAGNATSAEPTSELLPFDGKATSVVFRVSGPASHVITIFAPPYGGGGFETSRVDQTKPFLGTLETFHGWYDFTVRTKDTSLYRRRFAGRLETGRASISDPGIAT